MSLLSLLGIRMPIRPRTQRFLGSQWITWRKWIHRWWSWPKSELRHHKDHILASEFSFPGKSCRNTCSYQKYQVMASSWYQWIQVCHQINQWYHQLRLYPSFLPSFIRLWTPLLKGYHQIDSLHLQHRSMNRYPDISGGCFALPWCHTWNLSQRYLDQTIVKSSIFSAQLSPYPCSGYLFCSSIYMSPWKFCLSADSWCLN